MTHTPAGTAIPRSVWTVGHSTQPLDRFLQLLSVHRIELLADVRRFPASRRHPHFNRENLRSALSERSIRYEWLEALGGRRSPVADSTNSAWRNAAFRGYADYMQTAGFAAAYDRLLELAAGARTAVMCSESVWWRCHRALISDLLRSQGVQVLHILGQDPPALHPYTPAARLADGSLTYNVAQGLPAARSEEPPSQPSFL